MRAKGFYCRYCSGRRLHVITTMKVRPEVIVRYRECLTCGKHRIKTIEHVVPEKIVATR